MFNSCISGKSSSTGVLSEFCWEEDRYISCDVESSGGAGGGLSYSSGEKFRRVQRTFPFGFGTLKFGKNVKTILPVFSVVRTVPRTACSYFR